LNASEESPFFHPFRPELDRLGLLMTPVESNSANLIQQSPMHSSPDQDSPIAFNDRRAFD
jgi:hypothetical protein